MRKQNRKQPFKRYRHLRQSRRAARARTTTHNSASAANRHLYLIGLILCTITLAVFQQVHGFRFLRWDDNENITNNPYMHPVTDDSATFFWKWGNWYFASYIPITRTVWVIIAQLCASTLNPSPFHVANLVVHTLNVCLVFLILRLLVKRDWPAGLGALLFALHPLQVEPVAWVTGMKDLLGGFFSLLAVWQYLHFAILKRDTPEDKVPQIIHYVIATACFILALLSKSSAVSLPFLVFALDHWAIGRPLRQSAQSLGAWILAAIPIILITKAAEGDSAIHIPGTLWGRPFVAGDAIAFYLYKLFLPWPLAADYGRTPDYVMHHWWGYVTWLVPCGIALLLWLRRDKSPWLIAAFGIFVASILPVMGLVPFDYQAYSTVADRYIYVGLLGPAYALAWMLSKTKKQAAFGLSIAGLAVLGTLSVIQTSTWRDSEALFDHVIAVNPRSWAAHTDLGDRLAEAGEPQEAIAEYETALRFNPRFYRAHDALGIVLAKSGKVDDAMAEFQLALQYLPVFEEAQAHLANTFYLKGDMDQAVKAFRKAIKMNGDDKAARITLASILRSQKRNDEALAEFHEVLRIDPSNAAAQQALAEMGAK